MKTSTLTSFSIIVAGLLIAGAVMFTNKPPNAASPTLGHNRTEPTHRNLASNIRPIDENDHIRGNREAPIKVVEFSDLECPFCSRLHPTLTRLVEESEGEIAWVYRHFPLSAHRNARIQAVGAECIASIAGEDKFWEYIDFALENQTIGGKEGVVSTANILGVNGEEVRNCIDSGELDHLVSEDLRDATDTGGRGTPHSVVIGPDGKAFALSGAQPIGAFRQIAEQLIR